MRIQPAGQLRPLIFGDSLAAGLVNLGTYTVTGSAGALDTGAGGIPSGHGTLIIVCLAQSATASATEGYSATVNGDTSAIYDNAGAYQGSPTGAYGQTAWTAGALLHGTGGTSGYASSVVFILTMYDNTSFNKAGTLIMSTSDGSSGNNRQAIMALGYRSTSAISQFTFDCASHFSVGSTMTVYGTE